MKKALLTILPIFILASGYSLGGVELKAEQFKDGAEVVFDITIRVDQGGSIPLGGSDIPIRIDGSVLDLQNAYLDNGVPSDFDQNVDPSSYSNLSLYRNRLLVVRINENISGGGSGVLLDQSPKTIARVRVPILKSCATSTARWETKWGGIHEYTSDAWMTSIKDQVSFEMVNPELALFEDPHAPDLLNLGSDLVCANTGTTLATKDAQGFSVVWERDGVVMQNGTDTFFHVNSTGVYRVGYQNCSKIEFSDPLAIQVFQLPVSPDITEDQGTLYSSASAGNQWYFNGNVLTGSTGSSIVPSQSGTYSVEVSNQCGAAMSDDYLYMLSSLGQGVVASRVGVYPNPYFGNSNIYLDLVKESEVVVEVYDLRGIRVRELENGYKFAGPHEWRFETADLGLASGSYIIKIFADGRVFITTLIEASK